MPPVQTTERRSFIGGSDARIIIAARRPSKPPGFLLAASPPHQNLYQLND
jgi:hypothetical protein